MPSKKSEHALARSCLTPKLRTVHFDLPDLSCIPENPTQRGPVINFLSYYVVPIHRAWQPLPLCLPYSFICTAQPRQQGINAPRK